MTNLMKYNAANLDQLLDRINRNSIGMDEYFDRLFTLHETTSNYPPYNLIQVSNVESEAELALAGFKKKTSQCLHTRRKTLCRRTTGRWRNRDRVCPQRSEQRSFTRSWTLSDETEVRSVESFEDGLLSITLGRIVPQHHQRKDWF